MWKKIAVSAACGAAVVGIGTAALAESGTTGAALEVAPSSTTPTTTPSTTPSPGTGKHSGRHKGGEVFTRLGNVAHATWVAKDKDGTYVSHSAIHGSVTAVSATTITVKAGDGVTQTYAVTSTTTVRIRTNSKGSAGKIGDVKTGGFVVVTGTGTTSLTAKTVLAGLTK